MRILLLCIVTGLLLSGTVSSAYILEPPNPAHELQQCPDWEGNHHSALRCAIKEINRIPKRSGVVDFSALNKWRLAAAQYMLATSRDARNHEELRADKYLFVSVKAALVGELPEASERHRICAISKQALRDGCLEEICRAVNSTLTPPIQKSPSLLWDEAVSRQNQACGALIPPLCQKEEFVTADCGGAAEVLFVQRRHLSRESNRLLRQKGKSLETEAAMKNWKAELGRQDAKFRALLDSGDSAALLKFEGAVKSSLQDYEIRAIKSWSGASLKSWTSHVELAALNNKQKQVFKNQIVTPLMGFSSQIPNDLTSKDLYIQKWRAYEERVDKLGTITAPWSALSAPSEFR